MNDDYHEESRREKNRQSAARSRKRQRREFERLKKENEHLRNEVRRLQEIIDFPFMSNESHRTVQSDLIAE